MILSCIFLVRPFVFRFRFCLCFVFTSFGTFSLYFYSFVGVDNFFPPLGDFDLLNFHSLSPQISVVSFIPPTGAFFVLSFCVLVVSSCPLDPEIFIACFFIILSEEIQYLKVKPVNTVANLYLSPLFLLSLSL